MVRLGRVDRFILEDSLRTAIAGVVSFLIARLLRLPEAYWATFSALIVTQSSLGAAATISWQRMGGSVLGAGMGALLGTYFHENLLVYGLGVFVLGTLCALLRLGVAFRFAGVTLTLIMLVPRTRPAWVVATHRLIEVTVGIAVGLACTAVWPTATLLRREEEASASKIP